MKRTLLSAVLVPLVALLSGCPHDLTRRQWPDQQRPPDRSGDLARDLGAPDLVDASPGEMGDLVGVPDLDLGCTKHCVSTLAGKGTPGSNSTTVPLSKAEFATPKDVAVDKWDNVFVADTGNHVIRQIASGQVSVLAGAVNKPDFVDGAGAAARFYNPTGIAVDGNGVVYVADYYNNRIRKIAKGVVTTVAGQTKGGYLDGSVNVARFNGPVGVTVDSTGKKIYVADKGTNRIRLIENGVVSTIAGNSTYCGHLNGAVLSAQFCTPRDVAVYQGRIYTVEDGDYLRLIWQQMVSAVAGDKSPGFKDGPGTQAMFNNPNGVAVDLSGNILVADQNNHSIRLVTPAGLVTTIAGNGWGGLLDGQGVSAQFNQPTGIAVDTKGVIYVADSQNHSIRIIK